MATIPKDCCGTDIPILCIASLKRQHIPDNNLREAAAVVTLPTLAPTSAVMKWEHERVSVVGTDVPVREVVPLQEKMTYDKNAVHKMVGGSRDISVIADPDNNGGVIFYIAKQSASPQ